MTDEIVAMEDVGQAICEQIRTLGSVDSCIEYGGDFDSKDFSIVSSNAEWGTTCFVNMGGGYFNSPKRHIINNTSRISIFVLGLQDLDEEEIKIGIASMCLKTVGQLQGLIQNNNFGFALPQETRLGTYEAMNISLDEERGFRYAGYVFTFEITFKSANANPWQV